MSYEKSECKETNSITANTQNEVEKILSRLCDYYLSCLSYEDGVSVLKSKAGSEFLELDRLPKNNSIQFRGTKDMEEFLEKVRQHSTQSTIYLGYPLSIKKGFSHKENYVPYLVEPVFLFPIELSGDFLKINDTPVINKSVISHYNKSTPEMAIHEVLLLQDELGFNNDSSFPGLSGLVNLVQKLKSLREEWDWAESLDPASLSNSVSLKSINKEGIFNKAVLVVTEQSSFTKGLESELKSLANLPFSNFKETVLGQWLSGKIPSNNDEGTTLPLLEVLSLNTEQRQAIKLALANPLTIITGPPGTGKSQVVTNLIINAVRQGKKVLFASKNNKAVDVVETRVNNIGSRPILLRAGSQTEHRQKLTDYLNGLLNSVSSKSDHEEFESENKRYEQMELLFRDKEKEEKELIGLRNDTDRLDQLVEQIRRDLSAHVFNYLESLDLNTLRNSINTLQEALKSSTKNNQNTLIRLFWNYIKKSRLDKLRLKLENTKPLASALAVDFPDIDPFDEENLFKWDKFVRNLDFIYKKGSDIHNYKDNFKRLQKAKSLEEITKEKIRLTIGLAANAQSVWKRWLRLLPGTLSSEDRKMLSDYLALEKMVSDSDSHSSQSSQTEINKHYKNILKKISNLLPAWAVTSLSAKGKIPFEPGFFDIVILDEASQCDIASALPLLYRARQAVVIGDPKQLSHISPVSKKQDNVLFQHYDLLDGYSSWAYSFNSLFDLASSLVPGDRIVDLKDHHRCHSDIIEFSNKEFYNGHLRVATNYDRLKSIKTEPHGIKWVNVAGKVIRPDAGSVKNEKEAEAVANEIEKLIASGYNGSIGVVTPFRAQANLIREYCSKLDHLSKDHEFLVDTVHKFQGDEKDIMIFAPVVSKDIPGGSLNFLKSTPNLFNVAITRARAMLIVVGDMDAISNCTVEYLERFAFYYRGVISNPEKPSLFSMDCLGEEYPVVSNPERVSEWEHRLYKGLYKAGIRTIPQYQIEKYTLDFALIDKGRKLNIEVDGEYYHKDWNGELCRRDQIRNERLFELGWEVKRFWVYEVRDNLDYCIEQIGGWLKNHN